MAIKLGDIVIMEAENPYHSWVMLNLAKQKGYRRETIEVHKGYKELRDLRYGTIFSSKTMITLKLDKDLDKIPDGLKKINRRGRILLVECVNRFQAREVLKLKKELGEVVIELPNVSDYAKKVEVLENIIKGWGIKFDNRDTKNLLIRLMIRDETSWDTVRDLAMLYVESKKYIDGEVLESLYPNEDFYNLHQYFMDILYGKTRWKNYKKSEYYLHNKEYASSWLVKKLKEEMQKISLVYSLYRRGVINMGLDSATLNRRMDVANIKFASNGRELSISEQEDYLRYVKSIPYAMFKEIERVVYTANERLSEAELYGIIEEVKAIRLKYKDEIVEIPWKK